jgi:hypothetical protein
MFAHSNARTGAHLNVVNVVRKPVRFPALKAAWQGASLELRSFFRVTARSGSVGTSTMYGEYPWRLHQSA